MNTIAVVMVLVLSVLSILVVNNQLYQQTPLSKTTLTRPGSYKPYDFTHMPGGYVGIALASGDMAIMRASNWTYQQNSSDPVTRVTLKKLKGSIDYMLDENAITRNVEREEMFTLEDNTNDHSMFKSVTIAPNDLINSVAERSSYDPYTLTNVPVGKLTLVTADGRLRQGGKTSAVLNELVKIDNSFKPVHVMVNNLKATVYIMKDGKSSTVKLDGVSEYFAPKETSILSIAID